MQLIQQPLPEILDGFYTRTAKERPESTSPNWEDATGPGYKEALGVPNPNMPIPSMPVQGGMPGPWPQQQGQPQMPGGNGPQMMQQGFMIGPGGGPQMYQQMYPSGPVPMQQRPNGQGGMPQQPQQPQPGMQFGQQAMGQGNPQMGGPNQGNMAMNAAAPKFPAQAVPVMMPSGQYPPQGFIPQQGAQGQPGSGGPQGAGGPQQGQVMQPQMYMPGMKGGGPHQMQGPDS